jgi:hypothetical protein
MGFDPFTERGDAALCHDSRELARRFAPNARSATMQDTKQPADF